MKKGNAFWTLALVFVAGACASSDQTTTTSTMTVETGVPPLIARMRALESEALQVAVKKVWSAQITGDSEVVNAWLDGSTLLIEAKNPATHEYEVYSADIARQGQRHWMLVLGKQPLARAPHIGNGTIAFLTEGDGGMVLVNARTGSRIHHIKAQLTVVPSTDATSSGSTAYIGNYLTSRLAAVSGVDGTKGWDLVTNGLVSTTPVLTKKLANELIICGTDKGTVVAVMASAYDGVPPKKEEWSRQFAGPISGQPIIYEIPATENSTAKSIAVVPCEDGNLYGLDASTGQTVWALRTNAPFKSMPVAAGGMVFAKNAERLFCLDQKTGARVWWADENAASEYAKTQLFAEPKFFEVTDRALGAVGENAYLLRDANLVSRHGLKDGKIAGEARLSGFDYHFSNQSTGTLVLGTKDGIFMVFE